MVFFMNNTGYTGKSTPTPLYEKNKKDNKYHFYGCMFFFLFPIHGVLKIPCVPCVDTPTYPIKVGGSK